MGKDIDNINPTQAPDESQYPGLDIPEGANLEDPPEGEEEENEQRFSSAIFGNLPPLLKDACSQFSESTEKEVFLVSALGIVSGILPNVWGYYDGQIVYPNLFVYNIGAYGIGKGTLKYAQMLGMSIHKQRRETYKAELLQYKEDCASAKENNSVPPDKPGNKILFLPADNSKSGIIQAMDDNNSSGIICETEADSLENAISKDYGGFSDLLRKAFHHERISLSRRGDSEYREVEQPKLSIVLTSTPDQYQKLIPTVQNGLFSRFLHYRLSPSREFKNVFDARKSEYPDYFRKLGDTFKDIYNELQRLENRPIEFDLRDNQKEQFLTVFREWKEEAGEYVSTDLDGTVNRLGLICFRISMIFTALRNFEDGDFSNTLLCSDQDFENALNIVAILKRHAVAVFYQLPNPPVSREAAKYEQELNDKASDVARCQALFKKGKSYAEIANTVLGDAGKKSTVWRWLNT